MWAKIGTKLSFSTSCHPQTDGKMEVVNTTLGTLLRSFVSKNMKSWEECFSHVEFAYNRVVYSTTNHSPIEIVYGFNSLTPLDLLPLPLDASLIHKDGDAKARFVKKLHEKVKLQIEKKVQHYARLANKGKKEMVFEPGD